MRPVPTASASAAAPLADTFVSPGPAPQNRDFDPVVANRACEGCHETIAAEWRGSLHQRSHLDEVYQSQFELEPFPFCTGCHAPEAEPKGPVAPAVSALGVGCVTCHVVDGHVWAGAGPATVGAAPLSFDEIASADGVHPVVRAPAFGLADACAGCHQFAFPHEPFESKRGKELLMQSTITEHAQSAHADKSCAQCHMREVEGPDGRRHRDHRFIASRDEDFVRSAVTVDPSFDGVTLELSLEPGEVGHAFPTGDLLRRITVTIEVADASGNVVDGYQKFLGRHFGFERTPNKAPRRVLLRDDRVGGKDNAPIRFTVRERPTEGVVRYRITYDRVSGPPDEEGNIPIDGSILLKEQAFPLLAPP